MLLSPDHAGSSGSSGETGENSYIQSTLLEPRTRTQVDSAQYAQQYDDVRYRFYPVNQGNPVSSGSYYTQSQDCLPSEQPFNPAYTFTNRRSVSQPPQHGMVYSNPQQDRYNPAHYAPPNQGQNGNYSGSSSQQWSSQQAADYSRSPPQQTRVLTRSPSVALSPAHSPPAMSGQYPTHHHGRQAGQWTHPQPQGGISGAHSQGPGYYPAPHPSMVGPNRGTQGPPQHAHMASTAERHSPHLAAPASSWNSLNVAVSKAPAPPQNNTGGSPLFSLQMLVNQEMSRNAAAAQASPYRAGPHQQDLVDLSPASSEGYPRIQSAPIPLTRSDKPVEHLALRNGSIITTGNTNVTSPPTPLNGEVSSDSGLSSAAPTPSSLPDTPAKQKCASEGSFSKETVVSVIAQTPSKVKAVTVVTPTTSPVSRDCKQENITCGAEESVPDVKATLQNVAQDNKTSPDTSMVSPVVVSEQKLVIKQGDESLAASPPMQLSKDAATPVCSPKSGALKRVKKVDVIVENLVESGSKKVCVSAEQLVVTPPSVIVSPGVVSEDSGSAGREEEVVSPSPEDPDRPRRKRKLDKPVRLPKSEEASEAGKSLPTTAEPVSARGLDPLSLGSLGLLPPRRRRSSESSTTPPAPTPVPRTRRKSESDQQPEPVPPVSNTAPEQDKESQPEVNNAFIEVETELAKMFAGMDEEEDPLKLDTSPGLSKQDVAGSSEAKLAQNMKRGRPKGSRNGSRRNSDSVESPVKKKKSKQRKRDHDEVLSSKKWKRVQGDGSRDSPVLKKKGSKLDWTLYDSGSNTSSVRSRGPVVHVEGPKDSPYLVSVINAPTRGEDEEGVDKSGSKKQAVSTSRRRVPNYHNTLDYRGKVSRAGTSRQAMFSSTLSARYDAHTTDHTWICVFCKHGPHSGCSGDLFGPYIVAREQVDMCGDFAPDDRDINEEQKRGSRNKRSLRGAEMVEQFCQKMSKKNKRSLSLDSVPLSGMVPITTGDGAEGSYEVWVHEECAVWAAGVHLVGSHIVGLQEAVWAAVRMVCNKCGEGGANIGCVKRGCEWRLHVNCAVDLNWMLDEKLYIATCPQHKKGRCSPESILPT